MHLSGVAVYLPQASRSCQAFGILPSPFVPAAKQFLRTNEEQTSTWHGGRIILGVQNGATVSPECAPLSLMLDFTHWNWLNYLRTGVGRVRSSISMHNCRMAPPAICECGVEDQTADHIIPQNGVHDLQVLDDDTIKWLFTSCPNIYPRGLLQTLTNF